jgi:hypothetical protein
LLLGVQRGHGKVGICSRPTVLHAIDYLTGARFLSKEEDIVGPYNFGVYDVLVLPPSFPYGGMVSRLNRPPEAWQPLLTGVRKMPVSLF